MDYRFVQVSSVAVYYYFLHIEAIQKQLEASQTAHSAARQNRFIQPTQKI